MIYWQLMDINGGSRVCLLLYGKQFRLKFNGDQCESRKNQSNYASKDFLQLIVLSVCSCQDQKIFAIKQLSNGKQPIAENKENRKPQTKWQLFSPGFDLYSYI